MAAKQYGLILPGKIKPTKNLGTRVLNPLLDSDDELEKDEDEEEEPALNWVEASLKKSAGNAGQRSLQKRMLKEALEQDSTVFQYDEVFDDMKASQQKEREKKKDSVEKKPKYINTIMKHCEKRKLEAERRLERKVQREREEEGNEFADKESFVTPSYLKKLEELKQAEEEAKKEQVLEEMHDVHKHKNFGVFYNHLFKQRVGDSEVKQEPPEEDASENQNEVQVESTFSKTRTDQRKNIRARLTEDDSPERNEVTVKKEPGISDEDTGPRREGKRKPSHRGTSSDESRSRSPEPKRYRDRHRGETSREHKDRDRKDSQVHDGRRDRSSSRHRERNSKSQNRRQRSRSPKDHSRSTHRKDKQRGLDRKESPGRRRGTDLKRRDRSRSTDRSRKDKSEDGSKRRERRRDEEEKDRGKKNSNANGDKENKDESTSKKSKTDAASDPHVKQSINTTLGVTDVNKMKMEDRIKRFMEIFAKRTVGEVYENAVQKFFERKAVREAGGNFILAT